ncbi:MAG: transcriptional regulator [Desulfuromonadales bacterium]|nr:MAG: transcriptional regulator [Desulfuromonadales bacterium]
MRMLIMLILIYVGFKIVQGFMQRRRQEVPAAPAQAKEEETFQDPVCGVYVTEDDAVIGRLEGERLHFCSMACLEKYRESLVHKAS